MNKMESTKEKLLKEVGITIELFESLRLYVELGQFVSKCIVTKEKLSNVDEHCIYLSNDEDYYFVTTLLNKLKLQEQLEKDYHQSPEETLQGHFIPDKE